MALSALSKVICEYLQAHPLSSSKDIYEGIGQIAGYATVKRELTSLLTSHLITSSGKGKATKYALHEAFAIHLPVDPQDYFKEDIDQRQIKAVYNFDLIRIFSGLPSLFTSEEIELLENDQHAFEQRIAILSPKLYRKEFERLAVDLSWKSSQIEGNTYTLLETERLLKDQITANGRTRDEATMLLNHKAAIDFIVGHPEDFNILTIRSIEEIHSLLMKDLNVAHNIRRNRVGITGTNYRPLDNEFQIREALEAMCDLIQHRNSVFEKVLLTLLLVSYIQPFEDGNKRTARILSNAILIHHRYCPISFRGVDPIAFKEAMLIFYEQNNLSVIKKIFVDQFDFAVKTYF
jgi:fido (protein-threonine AMPylation protein)